MANEARITSGLQIRKGSLRYIGQPTSFTVDVSGTKGPTPGAITATIAGTAVDFSELTTPALCRLMNLDPTNYVEYGIYDPESLLFYPLGEILPGESYVIRLSRYLEAELGTGTSMGTAGPSTNYLMVKAHTSSCNVLVEAFEA